VARCGFFGKTDSPGTGLFFTRSFWVSSFMHRAPQFLPHLRTLFPFIKVAFLESNDFTGRILIRTFETDQRPNIPALSTSVLNDAAVRYASFFRIDYSQRSYRNTIASCLSIRSPPHVVAFSTLVDDCSPDRSVIIETKSGFGVDPVSAQFALLAILV
jgi:hypothetical protein